MQSKVKLEIAQFLQGEELESFLSQSSYKEIALSDQHVQEITTETPSRNESEEKAETAEKVLFVVINHSSCRI